MFDDLKRSHDELLTGIDTLERLCSQDQPDRAELASVRWRLGRSSSQRVKLVDAACAMLDDGPPSQRAVASHVRARQTAGRALSTRHVGQWTMERVLADWPGYCRASADLRATMQRQILLEADLLYPLLGAK